MQITVFYAWQSDRDKKVNRYFIQEAAEKALKRITDDASLAFSLKLDHDTKDVPGMPEITTTVLKKIEESHIFLADLTFVATKEAEEPQGKSKFISNPNVLFELGYAFKVLGSERIICVMNTAYGDADLQIFDLAHRRWPIRYELKPEDQTNKAGVKKSLCAEIESAVRSILKSGAITKENEVSQEQLQAERLDVWIQDGRKRWEELVEKDLAAEKPSRYAHGVWYVAYSLTGNFIPPDPNKLKSSLKQVENHRIGSSGWPVWAVSNGYFDLDVYPYHELLERWTGKKPDLDVAHSLFWRTSADGLMFLLRGYQEDCSPDKVGPGAVLWFHTPIWDVRECLLHSQRLAKELGDEEAKAIFNFKWEGLADRTLRYWSTNKDDSDWFQQAEKICRQKSVTSPYKSVSIEDIASGLPEIIHEITKPLYNAFNFYEPSVDDIRREISKMMKNAF